MIFHLDINSVEGRAKVGKLAGLVGIFCNIFLFIGKFLAGWFSGSMAVMADAFNNLSDASSCLISFLGFWMGAKAPDEEHPFGHARYEYLAGLMVCVMILAIGLNLLQEGVMKILHPVMPEFNYGMAAMMIFSIVVKLWMGSFNERVGRLIYSDTLKATAADSRNDSITTTAVLLSTMLGFYTNLNWLDGIAASLVAAYIIYSGFGLLKDALNPLLGSKPSEELVHMIEETVMGYPGVLGMHDLLVHDYGPGNQFASLHIEFPAEADVLEAHDLIDNIEREFWAKEHIQVVIHYDPIVTSDSATGELRKYITEQLQSYDERLSIHDLRIVPGTTHVNVLFDLLLPAGYAGDREELLRYIKEKLKKKNKAYVCVIKLDMDYV